MGVTVHRIITVTGRTQLVHEAHQRMFESLASARRGVAGFSNPCVLSQVHDHMNDLSTFTVHSGGSKSGYESHLLCERLMDDFSRSLADPLEFVDLSYSKDRYLAGQGYAPYARIENVLFRERVEDDD